MDSCCLSNTLFSYFAAAYKANTLHCSLICEQRIMIIRKQEILSFLLCVQLLGNSITYVHSELTAGAPG